MRKAGGRPKDENWNHVTKQENGRWKCKYCEHQFSGKISITRIKAHLNKQTGHGTAPCSFNRAINEGDHNNMASGSSNPHEHVLGSIQGQGTAPCSFDPPINEGDHNNMALGSSNPHEHVNTLASIQGIESEITLLNQVASDLQKEKSDIEGQVQWLQSRGKKRKRDVGIWLDEVEELRKSADELNNVVHPRPEINEIKQLIGEIKEHKENVPLVLSTEIVGENFETNTAKMWELLSNDQVFIIGVCGMGGVGKTLLATHLENEIKRKGSLKDVLWVTVPQDVSTSKLQDAIAKRIGVKLDEDDEKIRAEMLSSALETKEKPVLILDDVWKFIDLEKVGIHRNLKGIKVIVTTRLKRVCQQMDCLPENMIEMLPLEDEEAAELFKVKLGHSGTPATLPPEVENIATHIVKRCGGLPLGVSVMARTLKGSMNDIHWWKCALNKLEKLEMEQEVEEEVFKVLKRSYDNLREKHLQNCFLYCALFPEFTTKNELILKLVDIGLLEGRRSLDEIFYEGNNILDKLMAHSLLERGFCVSPFVRVMACNILKKSERCVMVKFLEEETYFQKELTIKEWKDLELLNLVICTDEKMPEIPEGTSPYCPHLRTLIICPPYPRECFDDFPNSFFKDMNALTILDLSDNSSLKSLPEALSDLRCLVSLTLRGCYSLKYVPPLEKLEALSRLDISHCSIEQVPQGLEMCINLKWLDMSWNSKLTMEADVLRNLTSMQYLDLRGCPHVKIKVEDVQEMKRLECLGGIFLNCKDYNRYVEIFENQGFGPKRYSLSLEKTSRKRNRELDEGWILPKDQRDLYLCDNDQWICLCGALSSKAGSSLNTFEVYYCKKLESVFCLSGSGSGSCLVCINICKLERLCLEGLESLTVICKEDAVDVGQSLSMRNSFPCLTYFHISGCPQIKTLLTPWLVLQLPNLQMITVEDCSSMEEIIAVGNGDDNDGSRITLPKLTTLKLVRLPRLKTLCKGSTTQIFGPSLTIRTHECPNLECDHPTLPLSSDSDSKDSDSNDSDDYLSSDNKDSDGSDP